MTEPTSTATRLAPDEIEAVKPCVVFMDTDGYNSIRVREDSEVVAAIERIIDARLDDLRAENERLREERDYARAVAGKPATIWHEQAKHAESERDAALAEIATAEKRGAAKALEALGDYLRAMDRAAGAIYTPDFRDGFRHALAMLGAARLAPLRRGEGL